MASALILLLEDRLLRELLLLFTALLRVRLERPLLVRYLEEVLLVLEVRFDLPLKLFDASVLRL